MNNKKKIGFAFGGGGARGFSHLGVLKVLQKNNIEAQMVSGTSLGAIIGAAYALGISFEKIEKDVLDMKKKKRIIVKEFFEIGKIGKSLIGNKKVYNFLKKYFGDALFADTKIPLRIVATDLSNGEEVVFKSGKIIDAVMASICVPGIFPPVKIGGKYYIDGGVTNPTPFDVLIDMKADLVLGIDFFVKEDLDLDNPSLVTTLLQAYNIIRIQSLKLKGKKNAEKVVMIKPNMRETINSFKFLNIEKFIEAGVEATEKILPKIKNKIDF